VLFGSINPAKGFGLLQAEAFQREVATRGPHLAQHMVDPILSFSAVRMSI
jgi:hypothetical protein